MWRLPLWRGYESALNSSVADLNNNPDYGYAGAITAALFLNRFVDQSEVVDASRHRGLDRPAEARPPQRRRSHGSARDLCVAESALRRRKSSSRGSYRRYSGCFSPRSMRGDAVDHKLRRDPRIGDRGDMRRDDDLRMMPERARLRQRLGLEHVERRAGTDGR